MSWSFKNIALIVYLIICVFDFIIVPLILYERASSIVEEVTRLVIDLKDNPEAMRFITGRYKSTHEWIPFTLRGAGLFHLSFGAILTGSVLRNKKEK